MYRRERQKKIDTPKPVTRIELNDQHSSVRVLIVVLLIVIGAGALLYSLKSYKKVHAGWTEIDVSALAGVSKEITLGITLGENGIPANLEQKKISKLCADTLNQDYKLLDFYKSYDELHNVYYINHHVNEAIEVDPFLYQSFVQLEQHNNRGIYLAPIDMEYNNLFYCNNDSEIMNYDPYQNQEARQYFKEVSTFAEDKSAVNIDLLGENRIRLSVSQEYLDYAKEIGFTNFIDFYWMKNAFLVDHLAEALLENGYTYGSISSFDGFTRNLDDSGGKKYSYEIIDRNGRNIYPAAFMCYRTARSIVCMRNYPLNRLDRQHYYEMENGEIRFAYSDIKDGLCKSATNNLVCYSTDYGCTEVMLNMIPVYITNEFQADKLEQMKVEGIYSVYCEDQEIVSNDERIELSLFYKKDDICYRKR